MRLLAIETSVREASVAILENDRLVAMADLPADEGTAKVLAPTISRQLALSGWTPQDIELVAVSQGPGSFTGLRVAVTTAKTMAYAVGAEVLGVNTLEVIGWQVPEAYSDFWAAIDAQRQQVFAARFHRCERGLETTDAPAILENRQWLDQLAGETVVTGPALRKLHESLPKSVKVVDPALWSPTAATVGKLAYHHYQQGRRDDLWKLVPQYYRKSAAEEKLSG